MGINNINLSPELLAALYPDSLVLEKDPQQPVREIIQGKHGPTHIPLVTTGRNQEVQLSATYRFLGNNLRKISFVVHYPDAVFLPEDQLEFLSRMLSACHCTIADISVLNAAGAPIDIQELSKQLNPEILFLCGVSAASVNIPELMEPFTITRLQGISMLLLPALNNMNQKTEEGKQLKTKLWNCLQKLFRV